jgi:quercetin dioxygenase-like cupin family protein
MKLIAGALLPVIALLAAPAQSPVPVGREPRHHLKFENQYVRVFDVVVPPGDATLFHTHANDYAFVSIGDANLKAEVLGGQPADLVLKDGEVRFTKGVITHRVTNVSRAPFRNITIEILSSPGGKNGAADVPVTPGHTLVLENDRIRVERIVLEPGQSTEMHEHALSGLAVVVSAGKIVIESPGKKAETAEFKPGDFRWHTGPVTHKLTNVGKSRFEGVGLEWK